MRVVGFGYLTHGSPTLMRRRAAAHPGNDPQQQGQNYESGDPQLSRGFLINVDLSKFTA
jgi:hypothetical protein